MSAAENMRITVTENGPFQVEGGVPLLKETIATNEEGESWEWREGRRFDAPKRYRLCRCGGSANKPFCDDSHLTNGFNGTETASRESYMDQAETFPGPEVTLTDAKALCSFARFCGARGSIWRLVKKEGTDARELTEREGTHCPSGRLVVWRTMTGDRLADPAEPELEPSIGVVEDPKLGVSSGLWVRGGIPVYSADGTPYELRNRMMLCRCGVSENKPFCDGSHSSAGFNDGMVEDQLTGDGR
jgi:CDGSH-type Zn-finger protein